MKMPDLFLFLFILLFHSLFPATAIPHEMPMFCHEFRVGGGARPDVASLPNGNIVICWEGGNGHVLARIFDRNGVPVTDNFQASATPSDEHPEPRIASQTNGNFLICWEVYKEAENKNSDVYGQFFSQDGSPLGPEFIACSNPVENWSQRECDVVALNNGDFIVVWMSYYEDSFQGGIFGQRFTSSGETVGAQFQLNSFPEEADERAPNVTSFGESGFGAVWFRGWFDFGPDISHEEIAIQRFNARNECMWTEKTVCGEQLGTDRRHAVTALHDSTFVVCWSNWSGLYQETVWARKYDRDGIALAAPFRVNTALTAMALELSIATLNSGDFVICWRHHTPAIEDGEQVTHLEIHGQIFNEAAEKVGEEFKVNSISGQSLRHNYPSVIAHGDSGFVVVWMEKWETVYGKVFSTDSINVRVEEEPPLPEDFELHLNFPNPFHEITTIPYALPERAHWYYVKIRIYNSLGAQIKTLRREYQNGGRYSIEWDGRDSHGTLVANGVYFCQFDVNGAVKTSKLIFVK
ncbi:MAG: FlgD immunoglobulin-like domain containing protein [Candidatus Zhuqueibacterota bacterium]